MSPRRHTGARAYALLLRLYPGEFRARYGRAMTDFHRDRIASARAAGESLVAVWLKTILDVASSAVAEHVRSTLPREPVMRNLSQDLGYAIRGLLRRPAFTIIVVTTIALGVGANAAIFSVVNGILLRPLPYPNADRVVTFGHEPPQWLASEPDFIDYRRELRSFELLAAYTQNDVTLTSGDNPERLRMVRATEDFFPALGVKPLLGRGFANDEYAGNPPRVLVISYGLWQRRFGGDSKIVGQSIPINGVNRTIVGVMPPHFNFPQATTDVWTPMPRMNPDSLNGRANHFLFMVGRLTPAATVSSAFTEANVLAKRFMRDFSEYFDPRQPLTPHIVRVEDQLVRGTRPYLLALLGAVGLVLLIACANVANLLLVRGESRQREMAVRSALGASSFRLLTQSLTESAVLAVLGGGLGLLIAWLGDRLLLRLAPPSIPRLDEIGIDWRVVAFCALASTVTGMLIGIVPGWRASRGHAADTMKAGGRSVAFQGSRALRRTLVVTEIMLAVVTLAGAGMLLRSLWNLQNDGLGFDPRGVLTAKVALWQRSYDDQRTALFVGQTLDQLRALPGVRAAGALGWLPVVDAGGLWSFEPEGKAYPPGRGPSAVPQQATPGALAALGLAIVSGRDFAESDRESSMPVAIVSEQLAQTIWPGENALGKRFKVGGEAPLMTIVGVVRDIRARGFGDIPEPTMYFAFGQSAKTAGFMPRNMTVLVRTSGDPAALGPTVRSTVHALDKMVPVSEMRTLEQVVGGSVSTRRFNTALLAGFAALALVLAGIGTYGVISYGVTQRTFEIGVRMALGAEGRSVVALVMSEGMRLAVVGLVAGLALSMIVARTIRAMLVGVSPIDAPSLIITAVLLIAVAAAATALPARRALRVSPVDVMREG